MIRNGVRIADIGCDHAYITTEALRLGKAVFAVASDVRPGPLSKARDNIEAAGLSDKAVLLLTDGLDGIEQYAPDDIIIAGMGGELIADIIERAPFVKNGSVRLILQPMTSQDKLREYLCSSGFRIDGEAVPVERGRIYQVISAYYTGEPYVLSAAELAAGQVSTKSAEYIKAYQTLLKRSISKYEKISKAKTSDTSKEIQLIKELNEMLKETGYENG